jgi:hypothetical protein
MNNGLRSTQVILATLILLILSACRTETGELSPVADDPNLLYGDDFSAASAGSWLIEADEFGSTTFQDGRLIIDVGQANSLQYATLQEPALADFDLTVDAQLLQGDREATYGVLFRVAGPETFYRFELTGDGRYVIEKRDLDGSWDRLTQGWQESTAIIPGQGAVNRLRIKATGPELAFYVNGELLQELQDSSYQAGQLALDAGTFGNQRTIVAFDNLAVGQP